MNRVLITGGSGFIGYHCLRPLLDRGYEVHAVAGRSTPPEGHPSVHWHQVDLLAQHAPAELIERVQPTHLLHLAWYVAPGKLITAEANFDWVSASLALLRSFVTAGGVRAVVSGTAYEYDWNYGYCSEDLTPTKPNTVYGACKRALQMMVDELASVRGLSSAWARIFFLYGPREHRDRLVASVIRSLLRGQPALCSHGLQMRDYLHVQDVADAVVALLDSDVSGPVNISSGRPVQLSEIVSSIGRLLERPELIRLGAIPSRANDSPWVVGNNSRLVGELGWKPQLDLESGLRQTINWWDDVLRQELQTQ